MASKAGTNTSEIERVQRRGSCGLWLFLWSCLQIPGRYDVILRVGKEMDRLLKGSVQAKSLDVFFFFLNVHPYLGK